MARRQYTEQERAAALASLAALRGDLTTARAAGVPETTLRRWSAGQPAPPAAQTALAPLPTLAGDDLYDQLAAVAQAICAALLARVAQATFPELCTGLALVLDRMAALAPPPSYPVGGEEEVTR